MKRNLHGKKAGDTIAPKIELYKRFKPFTEDILPTLITAQSPAYVAHPYAEQAMPFAIDHPCTIIIGPEGGFIPYEVDLLITIYSHNKADINRNNAVLRMLAKRNEFTGVTNISEIVLFKDFNSQHSLFGNINPQSIV